MPVSEFKRAPRECARERERTERRYTDTRIQVGADTFGSCLFLSVFAGTEQEMLFLSFGTYGGEEKKEIKGTEEEV